MPAATSESLVGTILINSLYSFSKAIINQSIAIRFFLAHKKDKKNVVSYFGVLPNLRDKTKQTNSPANVKLRKTNENIGVVPPGLNSVRNNTDSEIISPEAVIKNIFFNLRTLNETATAKAM